MKYLPFYSYRSFFLYIINLSFISSYVIQPFIKVNKIYNKIKPNSRAAFQLNIFRGNNAPPQNVNLYGVGDIGLDFGKLIMNGLKASKHPWILSGTAIICMYTYIYTYEYIYIYVYVYIYINIYMYVHIYIYIHIFEYYVCIHTYLHMNIYTYMYIYMYIYTYKKNMYMYIYTYIFIYLNTYV
jgi:hypothetical protein